MSLDEQIRRIIAVTRGAVVTPNELVTFVPLALVDN